MINKFINNLKAFDKVTFKILKYGLNFCFVLCLLSVLVLLFYNIAFPSPFMYYIGIFLFKLSLVFGIEFIVCGFVADSIKKELI